MAREVARTGYVALVIDCAQRGTAKHFHSPGRVAERGFQSRRSKRCARRHRGIERQPSQMPIQS